MRSDSGAISQKTLSQKRASGPCCCHSAHLETHCMPRWRNAPVCKIEPESVEEWLLSLHQERSWPGQPLNKVKHVDLDEEGSAVIPIFGTHFGSYAKLFSATGIQKRCAILTDGDLSP
jgi:hypothetical protein